MSDLKKLSELCNNSVSISINSHRDYYQSVMSYLLDSADLPSEIWQKKNNVELTDKLLQHHGITKDELDTMIKLDTIVEGQFYPHTANGFFTVVHYDVDAVIEHALELVDGN